MLLSAARAHVSLNTSDFSLLFAEAAVVGPFLCSAQSPRVGITPPYLGVLEAVGFHASNSLVKGLLRAGVGDLLQLCTAGSPQSPGSTGEAGGRVCGGEYCQTCRESKDETPDVVWITSGRGGVCRGGSVGRELA